MSETSTQPRIAVRRGKPVPPDHIRKRPILHKKVWRRVHEKDKNYMAIVCGETGSGKSEFGLRFCELIDPTFSADRIAFTLERFLELVNEEAPQGSAILFDEVGVALSHATHYDKDQIEVNHVLQTWREQNRILIMTSPHIRLVQKSDRGLLHAQMDMKGINRQFWISKARYRNIRQHEDDGNILKPYPKLRNPDTHRRQQYTHLKLYKPSNEVVEPYLERKIEFNRSLNEEVLSTVRGDDEADMSMSAKDIAEEIKKKGTVNSYISIHGGNKKPYIDAQLIELDYKLSVREAQKVKKVLDRDEEVSIDA